MSWTYSVLVLGKVVKRFRSQAAATKFLSTINEDLNPILVGLKIRGVKNANAHQTSNR